MPSAPLSTVTLALASSDAAARDDLRHLLDQHALQGDPLTGGGRLGLQPGALGFGFGDGADPEGLGLRRLLDARDEFLLLELGVAYRQLSLGLEHGHLRLGLRQRSGLGGLGLGPIDLGLVAGLGDLGLALVLSLVAERLLVGLGGGLFGLGLGDVGIPLDGRLMGCSQGGDVARAAIVDGLDLKRVDDQADLFHLWLRRVEDLLGQPLALPDDLLHRHRADDGAEVTGEDPSR